MARLTIWDALLMTANQINNKFDRTVINWLNIKNFGAKGDGETDDSGAIQKAVDYLYKINPSGGTLFFPSGVYLIKSPINIQPKYSVDTKGKVTSKESSNNPCLHLTGESMSSTCFLAGNPTAIFQPQSQFSTIKGRILFDVRINNIMFDGELDDGSYCDRPFLMKKGKCYPNLLIFESCKFSHFRFGFKYDCYAESTVSTDKDDSGRTSFVHCKFVDNEVGCWTSTLDQNFFMCKFQRNSKFGIHINSGGLLNFQGGIIKDNGSDPSSDAQINISSSVSNILFDSVLIKSHLNIPIFRAFYNSGLQGYIGRTSLISSMNLLNCEINGNGDTNHLLVVNEDESGRGIQLNGINLIGNTIKNFVISNFLKEITHFESTTNCFISQLNMNGNSFIDMNIYHEEFGESIKEDIIPDFNIEVPLLGNDQAIRNSNLGKFNKSGVKCPLVVHDNSLIGIESRFTIKLGNPKESKFGLIYREISGLTETFKLSATCEDYHGVESNSIEISTQGNYYGIPSKEDKILTQKQTDNSLKIISKIQTQYLEFTGDEDWIEEVSSDISMLRVSLNISELSDGESKNLICSHFKSLSYKDMGESFVEISQDKIHFEVPKGNISTVNGWKTFIKQEIENGRKLQVVYGLMSPKVSELSTQSLTPYSGISYVTINCSEAHNTKTYILS